jgi:predicted dehydrogenase
MNILIIGAGMYVTGRDGTGVGTILAALAQASTELPIEHVVIAARNARNAATVRESTDRINGLLHTSLPVSFQQIDGNGKEDVDRLCDSTAWDAAIIAIPDHLHFAYAEPLLARGVHTLVVKPLVPTLKEARQLVAAQRERNVLGMVEFHKRYDETNLYVRKSIGEGLLGKLLYFSVGYSQRISIPRDVFRGWSEQTNIFQYLGVHYVDLIYFLTGARPVSAMGIGIDGVLKSQGINTPDSVQGVIRWRMNGSDEFISHISTSWVDPQCSTALSDQAFTVVGTKGRIVCDQKNRGLELVHETEGVQAVNPYFSAYLPGPDGTIQFGGYGYRSIRQFLVDCRSVTAGRATVASFDGTRPTFVQSLVSTAVVEAVNESLRSGSQWIAIDETI